MHMKVQWLKKKRNKRMILRIKDGNVIVSTPYSTSQKEVEAFIEKSKPWILNQLKKEEASLLSDGMTIQLFGRDVRLIEDCSCALFDSVCTFCQSERKWRAFLLKLAKEYIEPRFIYWARRMGYKNLTLKFGFYQSKWGSCRKDKKEIRFNAYLVYCSKEAIDAVIVHELCHLKYANHSTLFYQEVNQWYPNYKQAHAQLKKITIYRCRKP